jgi:hypothetical protein
MMKNKIVETVEIGLDDIKTMERAFERLEREMANLKYYLYSLQSGDKNLRYSKTVLIEMERILQNEVGIARKKLKDATAKSDDEKRFLRMSKINARDKKAIERMGKTLKVRSSVLTSAVKTSELKKKQRGQADGNKN